MGKVYPYSSVRRSCRSAIFVGCFMESLVLTALPTIQHGSSPYLTSAEAAELRALPRITLPRGQAGAVAAALALLLSGRARRVLALAAHAATAASLFMFGRFAELTLATLGDRYSLAAAVAAYAFYGTLISMNVLFGFLNIVCGEGYATAIIAGL